MDMSNIPQDVLRLIFEQLVNDYDSLCNAGLACRSWRASSLPALLQVVDLSSHNNGRVPEHERNMMRPVVYADYGGQYRQRNLVPRQRAFLRLIVNRPELAKYIQSLTWTLLWADFEDREPEGTDRQGSKVFSDTELDRNVEFERVLTDIDRQTWNVFSRMTNVVKLDLASLHDVTDDNIVRQNPARLFPAVTHLRLLGWMHRELVKAIISSLDPKRLRSLKLDYLLDEGCWPGGTIMGSELAGEHLRQAPWNWRRTGPTSALIGEELLQRQEAGTVCIFPGPMWYPLRLLSGRSLDSLQHLQIKLSPFCTEYDTRSYRTMFQQTSKLLKKTRLTLKTLAIVFGVRSAVYWQVKPPNFCGTGFRRLRNEYRPQCIKMTAGYLHAILKVLAQGPYPHLKTIRCEGFQLLEDADPHEASRAGLDNVFQLIRSLPFLDAFPSLTEVPNIDHRDDFHGYDFVWTPSLESVRDIIQNS